jgi:hypothetical protein
MSSVRMTKMWEYTGIKDPDRVSTTAVSTDEVWSWLDVVLKVGNLQTVGGLEAFEKERRVLIFVFADAAVVIAVKVDIDNILMSGADPGQDGV